MKIRYILLLIGFTTATILVTSFSAGRYLAKPHQQTIKKPESNNSLQAVSIGNGNNPTLKGWLLTGDTSHGGVLLLHGVKSNRLQMLSRAMFLHQAGYTVLLIDFQTHGESIGKQITFGYLESFDVNNAFQFLSQQVKGRPIGIIGVSLGGAATLLSNVKQQADAIVIEAVYSSIEQAISNRLAIHAGEWSRFLTPLLTWQFTPNTGVSHQWLRPIDHIASVKGAIFVIAGKKDRHTLLKESQQLFEKAKHPKQHWYIDGAAHQDFYTYAGELYQKKILTFFANYLVIDKKN